MDGVVFKSAEFYLVSLNEVAGIKKFMSNYGKKLNGRNNVNGLRDFYKQFIIGFLPTQFPALYIYVSDFGLVKYFGPNSDVKEINRTVNKA